MLADILPERRRAFVFSRRNIIYAAVVAVVTFIAGRWLSATIFPYNYQAMYAFSLVGAALSCIAVGYLKMPASEVIAPRRAAHRALSFASISWGVVHERVLGNRAFLSMTFDSLVFNFGMWMAWPLYVIYFVNELNADDGWLGLNSAIGSLSIVFGFYIWEKAIRQKGFHWVLVHSMPLSALYPLLLAIFPDLTLFLAARVLIGLINPGKDLSQINVLLKLCPRERRASYLGFYNTVMNLGAFVAPLLAVEMADQVGIRTTLLVSAAVRLGGALLFYVFKVDVPPEEKEDV